MDSRLDYDKYMKEKKDLLTKQTDKIIDAHTSLEEKTALSSDRISSVPLDRPLNQPTGITLDSSISGEKSLGEKIMDSAANALETTKETLAHATTATKESLVEAATATKSTLVDAATVTKSTLADAAVATKETLVDAALSTKETLANAATWVKEHTMPSADIQAKAEPIIENAKEVAVDIKHGIQEAYVEAKGWVKEHVLPDNQKTATEKLNENLEVAKETLAEGWVAAKEKIGEAAGLVQQALQPENQQKIKGEAKKAAKDVKEGAKELLDEAGNKLDQAAQKGQRKARRGGRNLKNKADNLGEKAEGLIEQTGEAIQGALKSNAPRKGGRLNKKGSNQRSRAYQVWVPKAEQTAEGQKILDQSKSVAEKAWANVKEKAGDALDWADKKLTPESQKTVGDKVEEFGDKVADKANSLAFKAKEKITPESQKTVGDKLEEKAFHVKEAVKDKLE